MKTTRRLAHALHPKSSAGFTLLELLVLTAIIGVIAAILFPVFNRAKEAGKKTTCISNMRQIGVAILSYLANNDDVLPQPSTFESPTKLWNDQTVVGAYLKNEDIFHCPSAPKPVHRSNYGLNPFLYDTYFGTNYRTYQGNSEIYCLNQYFNQNNPPQIPNSFFIIKDTSSMILAMEIGGNGMESMNFGGCQFTDGAFAASYPYYHPEFLYQGDYEGYAYYRHFRGKSPVEPKEYGLSYGISNALFADGHAKGRNNVKISELRPSGF